MVLVSVTGCNIPSAMIDMTNYARFDDDLGSKLAELNERYCNTVESARRLYYDKSGKRKNISTSTSFQIGRRFLDFVMSVQGTFMITNYTAALSRDFGLGQRHIADLLAIAKSFEQKDIIDPVPLTYYRELKRKQNPLEKIGHFKSEKKRLNRMGRTGNLPTRELYEKELVILIKNNERL